MNNIKYHIVIFRTSGSYIDYNTYNCQELGLSKALTRKGYKVSLIMAGAESKQLKFDVDGRTVDIYYLTYKSINQSLCLFDGWKELLNRITPDVIQLHEFGMYMSYLVSNWAKHKGVRCVLIQGNYKTTQKPGLKQLECLFNSTFGQEVLRNVSSIGCKTKAAAEYVARYNCKPTMLTPVGLDESKFEGCTLESDFRERYGLTDKKILLYVGKMEQRRNPMFLLDLMKTLPNEYTLVMVGDGPLLKQVKERAKTDNMQNVLVLGKMKQEELPAIYAASDLFLLASNYEIFGMVIMESMYFGTPVISTSTAGADTLIDSSTGRVIKGLDLDTWKRNVEEICSNQNILNLMKENCQKTIRGKYVWDKASETFEELYRMK